MVAINGADVSHGLQHDFVPVVRTGCWRSRPFAGFGPDISPIREMIAQAFANAGERVNPFPGRLASGHS